MALSLAAPARILQHRRSIDIQVCARGNGLWEVDARLTDLRMGVNRLSISVRRAGAPIHDMLLRLVVGEAYNILEAGSETRHMPYGGRCGEHGDAYARLAGLNVMSGGRQTVKERPGGAPGCTDVTEMTQSSPAAVVQALAGTVFDARGEAESARQPFPIDRCHAPRGAGKAGHRRYPRWYRQRTVSSLADTAPAAASASLSSDLLQTTSSS